MKKLVLTICLFLAIPCAAQTIAVDDDGATDFNNIQPATRQSAQTTSPEYAPNEIIVKFSAFVSDPLEEQLKVNTSARNLRLSQDLDELNAKHQLKSVKPLFKNFRKSRQRQRALRGKGEALLTQKEKHILRRLKRAPKNARIPDLHRIYKLEVELAGGQSLKEVVETYRNAPDVEYAELNYIVSTCKTPNDPLYSIQWPLNNTEQMYPESGYYNHPPGTPDSDIDAPEAWDIHTESSEIIVALVDTGVDYNHRDLQANMWINIDEIPGNGFDDDENGYVDDIYGYDFCTYKQTRDADPMDDAGHGTHCAGIIAADGDNGLDIIGVCWGGQIMAAKFMNSDGWGVTDNAVEAFYYAVENGADVISNSWGGGDYSQAMEEAIAYAYSQGVVMVAAAGNDGSISPQYPAYYDHVISVAATDSDDTRAPFSNYGDWVDIAAPGVDVLSLRATGTSIGTIHNNYTTIASGTSMSCPHVSGACALMLSYQPYLPTNMFEQILLEGTDPISPEICASGRLNLYKAVQAKGGFAAGIVILERDVYSCSDTVQVTVRDSSLVGNSAQDVNITTSGGDSETVTLTAGPLWAEFTGTILTTSGDPITEDGTLQVFDGQIITATYYDANDGTGNPAIVTDTASMDCLPPEISNVHLEEIKGGWAWITFDSDELTTGFVRCGTTCGGPYPIDSNDPELATTHTLLLTGLSSETTYYFVINAIDAIGNETLDDNNGACYLFTTPEFVDLYYVPSVYPTIQSAIDAAQDGDTVWVADGTYTGDGNRDIDFKGKAITVRSEDGPNNCVIDCQGSWLNLHRGFYFHSGETSASILMGLTITNSFVLWEDGAIFCDNSSPTITDCIITDNRGDYSGGVYCFQSSPVITNCTIENNWSYFRGGGICCSDNSTPTITDCTIARNEGPWGGGISTLSNARPRITNCIIVDNWASRGGGIYCTDTSSPTITNCDIVDNVAFWNSYDGLSGRGGGVCSMENASPTITECTISDNSAASMGGGLYACKVEISNCTINGNFARDNGGGVCFLEDNNRSITNCTITRNFARGWVGGIYCEDGSLTVTNCTISGNLTYINRRGGGLFSRRSNTMITNCILWRNCDITGIDEPAQIHVDSGTVAVNYSCIQGLTGNLGGAGNINVDPQLTRDGHLQSNSPCIDAGDPCYSPLPTTTDIDGEQRVYADRVDMGADELIDTDSDSLPDWWEQQYFCSPTTAEPNANPDNDCQTNIWEYVYSSDPAHSSDYYVDPIEGSDGWDGLAPVWDGNHGPKRTIQTAIDTCPTDQYHYVVLAPGTYTGQGNRDLDFRGKTLTVRSINPKDPNVVARTIIDCNGTYEDPHRGFHFHNFEYLYSIVAGMTITNGYCIRGNRGSAGIYCDHCTSPTIIDCNIIGNSSGGPGGAIYCGRQSCPVVTNCVITRNTSVFDGGGIYCDRYNFNSCPVITNCTITSNSAGRDGGGLCQCLGPITNCTISGNSAGLCGGGIFGDIEKSPRITNCIIAGNFAGEDGGGLYFCNSSVTNCIITDNSAQRSGGGLANCYGPVTNCIISGNSARRSGGGMASCHGLINNCIISGNFTRGGPTRGGGLNRCNGQITNCTITGNAAGQGGGLARCDGAAANCIIWNNSEPQIDSFVTITFSDVEGGCEGEGNIDTAPFFIHPGFWDFNSLWIEGDYHLLPDSPCIDAGDNTAVSADTTDLDADGNTTERVPFDLDGNPRFLDDIATIDTGVPDPPDYNEIVDMGAYEFSPPIQAEMKFTPQTLNCNSKGNWVKAHFVLPEGFLGDDVDVNKPAVVQLSGVTMYSEYIVVLGNDDGPVRLEIAFDRHAFCDLLTNDDSIATNGGSLEIRVVGYLTTGRYFSGTDTIRIKPRR